MRPVPPVDILYSRLAMALDRGDPIHDEFALEVAKDLIQRRTSVESFAPTAAFLPPVFRWAYYAVLSGTVLLFALFILSAGMFALAAMFALAGVLALIHAVTSNRLYRACRVSITGVCVACGYNLAGLDDAVPPARLRGASIGPARCPECATLWPKVPRES